MQNDPSDDWKQPIQANSAAPYQAVASEQTPSIDGYAMQSEHEAEITQVSENVANTSQPSTMADDETSMLDERMPDDEILVRWQSAEHLYQERTALWYVVLAIITIVLMIVAYQVFRSLTFTILLPVMALALAVYAHRPPEIIEYVLSRKGLYVRDRLMTYDQFRSFGVVTINGINRITLIPRKRFQMGQNIYFPEEVGERVVDMLAARLPMKDIKPDFIDKLLAKLHL